jgi:hypothetical protein
MTPSWALIAVDMRIGPDKWRSGEMILRWTCAAMRDAERTFRRVQGFRAGIPLRLNALQKNDGRLDGRLDDAGEAG